MIPSRLPSSDPESPNNQLLLMTNLYVGVFQTLVYSVLPSSTIYSVLTLGVVRWGRGWAFSTVVDVSFHFLLKFSFGVPDGSQHGQFCQK